MWAICPKRESMLQNPCGTARALGCSGPGEFVGAKPGVSTGVQGNSTTDSQGGGHPLWGAPRIHGELLKLGIDIGGTSVGKYLVRRRNPPSQTWKTFLENHVSASTSV
jgi:hypothetical protein